MSNVRDTREGSAACATFQISGACHIHTRSVRDDPLRRACTGVRNSHPSSVRAYSTWGGLTGRDRARDEAVFLQLPQRRCQHLLG